MVAAIREVLRMGDALALAARCAPLVRDARDHGVDARLSEAGAPSWLEIRIADASRPDVIGALAQLRGVVDVLCALAQCAGYAPHLNPTLWEQLLHNAGVEVELSSAAPRRFDCAFPLVRLRFAALTDVDARARRDEATSIASALRSFARLEETSCHDDVIKEEMARLVPFVGPTGQDDTTATQLRMALALPSMDTQWLLPAVAAFTEELKASRLTVEVVEVSIDQRRFRSADPLDGVRWLEELPLVANMTHWTLDDEIDDRSVYERLYRKVLRLGGVDEPCAVMTKVQTLEVVLPNVTEPQFAALCRLLPFTQSVCRLHVRKDSDWEWDVLDSENAWASLGFAVFHQRTATSTWRELAIDGCAFRDKNVNAFVNVQQCGIEALPRFLDNGSGDDNVVCAALGQVGGVSFFSDFDTDRTIGDARARRASLTVFHARPLGSTSGSFEGVLCVIEALGSSMTTLELVTERPLSSHDVREILSSCPNLSSITLDHDGTCWTGWEVTGQDVVYPRMASIRQTCSLIEAFSTLIALGTSTHPVFPALQVLNFHVTRGCAAFPQIAHAVGAVLGEHTTLEQFAMVKVRRGATTRKPNLATPSERRVKLLARLGLAASFTDTPSPRSNIHFASLVRRVMRPLWTECETSLPDEIFHRILAFAAGGRTRHVYIDLA